MKTSLLHPQLDMQTPHKMQQRTNEIQKYPTHYLPSIIKNSFSIRSLLIHIHIHKKQQQQRRIISRRSWLHKLPNIYRVACHCQQSSELTDVHLHILNLMLGKYARNMLKKNTKTENWQSKLFWYERRKSPLLLSKCVPTRSLLVNFGTSTKKSQNLIWKRKSKRVPLYSYTCIFKEKINSIQKT